MAETLRRGGPGRCPRRCVECDHGKHHFSDMMMGFVEDTDEDYDESDPSDSPSTGPDHPAAKAGVTIWHNCKHCPAWLEWDGDYDGSSEEGPRGWDDAVPVERGN